MYSEYCFGEFGTFTTFDNRFGENLMELSPWWELASTHIHSVDLGQKTSTFREKLSSAYSAQITVMVL